MPESQITLLDLAENGFFIAEKLAEIFNAKNVKCVTGDMFSLPFPAETYDFVWNIGTLEHYDEDHIKLILSEMFRVTRYGGVVTIAIPNHNSLPMLKARLLGSPVLGKYLKWVKGYRADSEKNYSTKDILSLFETVARENNFILKRISADYIGSPQFVGAGKIGVLFFKPLELLFPKTKFLMMISGEKVKE
ncbi:MAG: hypothetical protein UZ19_OD1000698 [Parcubacteria bacterium OLB19]|nr:MAG: hypothetical protein UZ19_OD1000698 [Parcubacteria bacterium OLB19]